MQRKGSNLRSLEVARRAVKHLAARERKARVVAYLQYLKSRPAALTSPPRVIADGNSWFDYPEILLTGGAVIDHLVKISGVKILNAAHYGDSVQQMLGVEKRQRIEALLKKPGFDILLFFRRRQRHRRRPVLPLAQAEHRRRRGFRRGRRAVAGNFGRRRGRLSRPD
jgi:hypothetical protein